MQSSQVQKVKRAGRPCIFKGKSLKADAVAFSYCNFGELLRKTRIGRHFSFATAKRQFRRILDRSYRYCQQPGYCFWLEDLHGNVLDKQEF